MEVPLELEQKAVSMSGALGMSEGQAAFLRPVFLLLNHHHRQLKQN